MLALAAERAVEQFLAADSIRHTALSSCFCLPGTSERLFGSTREDLIDQAILDRLLATQKTIPVSVPLDGANVLAGMLGQDFVQSAAQIQDFLSVNLDV